MSRVLLCGAFGQENPGDDALLDAFTGALAGHDVIVSTDAAPPDAGYSVVPPRPAAMAKAVPDVDAVVVAGGTIFKSLHRSVPRHHLSLLARTRLLLAGAHFHGVPVALVGVGSGEIRTRSAARLARSIGDAADLLVLRDEESAAVLRRLGARGPFRIGADPAWTLPGLLTERSRPAGDHVLVALSHLAGNDVPALAGRLARIVEPVAQCGLHVRLQPWQAGGADERLAELVVDVLGDRPGIEIVERPASLHDAVAHASGARAVIGLRHHALVAAGAAGRPFFALSHEPKLAGLARRLGQQWAPPHAAPAVLEHAGHTLLEQDPPSLDAVRAEVAAATRAMHLLRVVVSGGADDDLLDRDRLRLSDEGAPW